MAGPGGKEHGRISIKVVPDTDGFTRRVERLLQKYEKRNITVKVDADTSPAKRALEALEKRFRKLTIEVDADTKKAEARLEALAKSRKLAVKADANTKKAEAQIKRATRDRTVRIQYRFNGDEAVRRVQELTRKKVQRITLEFDEKRAVARLRAIGEKNKIVANVEVNQRNIRDITKWIGSLGKDFGEVGQELKQGFQRVLEIQERIAQRAAHIKVDVDGAAKAEAEIDAAARDRRSTIEVDVDRGRLRRLGALIGRSVSGAGTVAQQAIAGMANGLSTVFSMFGDLGNVGQAVFGNLSNSIGRMSSKLANFGAIVAQVAALGASLGAILAVISAIISALGALIVSAIAAVAAIGSVVIGAAALVALPGIFAAVAASLVTMGDKQDRVKKQFSELAGTIRRTVAKTAKPMVDFFVDSLEGLNRSLREGTPLYRQLQKAFELSAKALAPLREGLATFAFQTLSGVNDALKRLNATGTFASLSQAIGGLGTIIGNFAREVSQYGPEISSGFNALVAGLDRIAVALARFIGQFAGNSVGVIDTFSNTISRLFSTFGRNAASYTNAAEALGNALALAVPGFERMTRAFANMAPSILYTLANAIDRLGTTLSDPRIQQGLVTLTNGIIRFAAAVADNATKISASLGNAFHDYANFWDSITGKVKTTRLATVKDFEAITRNQETTSKKVSAGLKQITYSMEVFANSTKRPESALQRLGWQTYETLNKTNQFTGQLKTNFNSLSQLVKDWQNNNGILTADMRQRFEEISAAIDKTANPALKRYRDQVRQTFDEASKNAQTMKQNLIKALTDAGIRVGPELQKQIDQALGHMTTSAQEKSQEAIAAIQQNFALLPGVVRAAMEQSKTPAELERQLSSVSEVINRFTPEIAQAFAKLPTEMQRTLTQSTAAFQTWMGMEVFRQKVDSGVNAAVSAFSRLGSSVGMLTGPMQTLGSQVTVVATSIHGANAQINWLNWILNQVGAQASWAGWQLGQVAANASQAANAMSRLNAAANGVNSSLRVAGATAGTAGAALGNFGWNAEQAGGRFRTFATNVSNSMVTAHQAVGSWTWAMESRLAQFQSKAASYGRLSSFVSSISSSMAQAQSIVSSAVAHMLGQLQRLNTTVTARVRVETQRVPSTEEITPNFVPNSFSFQPMMATFASPEFQPMALGTEAVRNDAPSIEWVRTAAKAVADERTKDDESKPSKVYNVTINAAPNVPTEKQIVKQLRFADSLYGDD